MYFGHKIMFLTKLNYDILPKFITFHAASFCEGPRALALQKINIVKIVKKWTCKN